jgi:hypothetical protein
MNIGGVRGGFEDKGAFGHEGRSGMCIGENEEESPWEPMHQFYGFNKEDSTVTLHWPNTRQIMTFSNDPPAMLRGLCDSVQAGGFDPGCVFIFCPEAANTLHHYGFSRTAFTDYIVEYARKPAAEVPVRWMKGNNHVLPGTVLPAEPTRMAKKFYSGLHLPVVVAGMSYANFVLMLQGGGDHGGPVTHKITLPKNWNKLVAKYKDV